MNYDPDAPTWGNDGLDPMRYSSDTPNETGKTGMALASVYATPNQVRAIRPPLPQVPLFPERLGYGHPVLDVEDCMDLSRDNNERYDFSGTQGGFTGSSVASMGMW